MLYWINFRGSEEMVTRSRWRRPWVWAPKYVAALIYRPCLKHWGRDKMAAISQTIHSNAFLNEYVRISIKISLKFVPRGPINNIPALVQIMPWRPTGDKPLSEPMRVRLPTHICVTRPQWVNESISGVPERWWLGPLWSWPWVRTPTLWRHSRVPLANRTPRRIAR